MNRSSHEETIVVVPCQSVERLPITSHTYFVGSCQQVVGHFFQVWGLSCVDEAHHFLKDIWVHVTDIYTVLQGKIF